MERLRLASLRSCLALSSKLLYWRLAICGWRGEDVAHTRTHTRKPTQRHMDIGKHGGSSVESMGHGHGQTAWHEPSTQRQSDCAPNADAKTFCLCALRVWSLEPRQTHEILVNDAHNGHKARHDHAALDADK